MHKEFKEDFGDAQRHWEAFWAGDIIDRPCINIIAPKEDAEPTAGPKGLVRPDEDPIPQLEAFERSARSLSFMGDAVPFYYPNFGPDIFATFFGAEMEWAFDTGTSWVKPFIKDWKTDSQEMDRPHGNLWNQVVSYLTRAAEYAAGRYSIGVLDLHSNLDCLAAVRGPQDLCFDLLDCPDEVEVALNRVRKAFVPVMEDLSKASGYVDCPLGYGGWLPFYCEGRFSIIQCDFVCMIKPEHARRFLYPALEEEARYLDHCCYHYDGPDALVHLDDILAIKDIDCIQWVPGAGNPPVIEWMDLLKKMQAAGKSVQISASPDEVKIYHKELQPDKVFYCVWASSEAEGRDLLKWLKDNM